MYGTMTRRYDDTCMTTATDVSSYVSANISKNSIHKVILGDLETNYNIYIMSQAGGVVGKHRMTQRDMLDLEPEPMTLADTAPLSQDVEDARPELQSHHREGGRVHVCQSQRTHHHPAPVALPRRTQTALCVRRRTRALRRPQ